MPAETVEIRNGSYCCVLILDRIDQWPTTQWAAIMRQMEKGGDINAEAVGFLAEWFPDAIREAKEWRDEVYRTYKRDFRPFKKTPRAEWEEQKAINAILNETLHTAKRRYKKLMAAHIHFLAAKASMKKEK